ncbi:MAG TPA: helix-turn-helix domain-containing protein [Steroidobacteraceae bacterium]|jgi:excisionase family DNA binding protein|nr:helix-turn-helix domain-containing protein [Steroidobacteraceae bacterium]
MDDRLGVRTFRLLIRLFRLGRMAFPKERIAMAIVDSAGAELIQPTQEVSALAADASRRLFRVVGASQTDTCVVRFESAPDEPLVLPAAAVRLLGALLTELAKGNAVTLVPHHAELTTQEAADLLNVSRPFLIGLLEKGQLPHHKVGTHRRVRFADLMTYKRRRDAESESALRELAALSQEMKLYT